MNLGRDRGQKPVIEVSYSPLTKEEINNLSLPSQLKVSDAVIFLQHSRYREETKIDLNLIINGDAIWALTKNNLWVAFSKEGNREIRIEWVSLISRFRQK
jgi:hypothetical protein